MDALEREQRYKEWAENNSEDIERRVAEFRRAYDKIVEEYRVQISWDYGGELCLADIDQKCWLAQF